MDSELYTWIQTRDGSPTLWSNQLSESFRSVKGAFTESWSAFVAPAFEALRHLHAPKSTSLAPIVVGEFGLGPGTNWMIWSLACALQGIATEYFVIERDLRTFELGLAKWKTSSQALGDFFNSRKLENLNLSTSPQHIAELVSELNRPTIYPSLETAVRERKNLSPAQIWFHDPFGYSVNAEGYSRDTLSKCSQLWGPRVWGGSYACNRHFKQTLRQEMPELRVQVVLTSAGSSLKRERLEFKRGF